MAPVQVRILRLPHGEGLPLPAPATAGSAGLDLASAEDGSLAPFERRLFATGFAIALPPGYECQLRPRSGLALRHGVTLPNTPATIDSDYRGELLIPVINFDVAPQRIEHGERVAQMVIAPVSRVAWREVDALPETERAAGGFGSTGMK